MDTFKLSICMVIVLSLLVQKAHTFHSTLFRDLEEIGPVRLDHTFSMSRRQRSADSTDVNMADFLRTSVSGDGSGDDINLTLTFRRAERNHADIPVYETQRGRVTGSAGKVNNKCAWIYTDLENMATAYVDTCTDGHTSMLAEVSVNGSYHVIMPDQSQPGGRYPIHKLYRPGATFNLFNDYVDPVLSDIPGPAEELTNRKVHAPLRRRRQSGQTYTVELLIVIDYSLYMAWYEYSTGTAAEREVATEERIKAMYAFAASAINNRYQNIDDSGPDIKVDLVAIYIAKTSADSPFTEPPNVVTGSTRGVVDIRIALEGFETWIGQQKAQGLPDHDHAILMSARDLSLDGQTAAAGLANKMAMCTTMSQSMAEDHFNFIALTIAAHEIGHGLNASHDSDGNSCPGDQGYIMTSTNKPMNGTNARQPWVFSSCSVDAFSDFVTSSDAACLQVDNVGTSIQASGTLPGQVYSPNEQCHRVTGSDAGVCQSLHVGNYELMCTGLYCKVSTGSSTCVLTLPADGTTCGDGKWCMNGECVTSASAPAADESCLFGDNVGVVTSGMTCAQVVSNSLYQCYDSALYDACCSSCSDARLAISGCVYGDRVVGCTTSSCSDAANLVSCCATCATSTTTPSADDDGLPDWVVPVAAGGGGALVLLLAVVLICCCRQSGNSKRGKHARTRTRRSVDHRHKPRRHHSNTGYHGDELHGYHGAQPGAHDYYGARY